MSMLSILYGRIGPALSVPAPDLSFYSDVPASITSSGGVVSTWSAATTVSGSPLVTTDTVVGGATIRTTNSDKLYTAAGAAGFLHRGPSTLAGVFRYRKKSQNAFSTLVDTTENGTVAGYQIRIYDLTSQRALSVRIHDGSSFVYDYIVSLASNGHWIAQKWHTFCVRLSSTTIDVQIDGVSVWPGGRSTGFTYPVAATGRLAIGGGPCDHRAYELYSLYLTDSQALTVQQNLALRFIVDLAGTLAGDSTLLITPPISASFPFLSKLPGGKLYAVIYNGADDLDATHSFDYFLSSDGGKSWANRTTLLSNSSSQRYGTPATSEPLSDGSVVQAVASYPSGSPGLSFVRRATTFDANGAPIWGSNVTLSVGSPFWALVTSAPVEDPGAPGHLHLAVYTQELSGDSFYSVWDYQSTDFGATWPTRVRIANGQTDSKRYAEPGFVFDAPGTIYCLIRDSTTNGVTPMLHSVSTNAGATWSSPTAANIAAYSSGQQVRKLSDGTYVWLGRWLSGDPAAMLFWRPAGSGLQTNWKAPPDSQVIDPNQALDYYAALYETSPGVMAMLYSRSGVDAQHNNVGFRANYPRFLLDSSMPGSASPSTATVAGKATQQITCLGAGDYTATITSNGSGNGSVSANTLGILYTAGVGAGADTIAVHDCNGFTIGTCTYTSTGSTLLNPINMPGANSVYRADHATNSGDGTAITAWNDELGLRNMAQPTSGKRFTYRAVGSNGQPDATCTSSTGMSSDQAALGTGAITLMAKVSWTSLVPTLIIFGSSYNASHYVLLTDATNPGQVLFRCNTIASGPVTIKSDRTDLNDGLPHVIAGTYDGSTLRMYVDGVLQTQTGACTGNLTSPVGNGDYNSIGCGMDGTNAPFASFIGHISGANSSNQAASQTQITQMTDWYAINP